MVGLIKEYGNGYKTKENDKIMKKALDYQEPFSYILWYIVI